MIKLKRSPFKANNRLDNKLEIVFKNGSGNFHVAKPFTGNQQNKLKKIARNRIPFKELSTVSKIATSIEKLQLAKKLDNCNISYINARPVNNDSFLRAKIFPEKLPLLIQTQHLIDGQQLKDGNVKNKFNIRSRKLVYQRNCQSAEAKGAQNQNSQKGFRRMVRFKKMSDCQKKNVGLIFQARRLAHQVRNDKISQETLKFEDFLNNWNKND